jgi:hypothetical protein
MTWHRAGFHGGPLIELWDLLVKIQWARAVKEASPSRCAPRLRREAFEKEAPYERLH